jgi:HEAT repeat protein
MRPLLRSLGGAVRLNEHPGDHRARQPFIDAWRVNEADLRAALVPAADQPSQLNELLYLLNVWDEMPQHREQTAVELLQFAQHLR